jgi:hypothetical protein
MRALLENEDTLVKLGCHALGNRQAEESGADDEEVETSGHRLPRVSDRAGAARFAAALGGRFLPTMFVAGSGTSAAYWD